MANKQQASTGKIEKKKTTGKQKKHRNKKESVKKYVGQGK